MFWQYSIKLFLNVWSPGVTELLYANTLSLDWSHKKPRISKTWQRYAVSGVMSYAMEIATRYSIWCNMYASGRTCYGDRGASQIDV